MKKNIKTKAFVFFILVFFCGVAYSAQKPSVPAGVPWKINNFSSAMPSPRLYEPDPSNPPIPTNRWYSSMYLHKTYHNFSLRIAPGPLALNYNTGAGGTAYGQGFMIGLQHIEYGSTDISLSNSSYAMIVTGLNASNQIIYSSMTYFKKDSDWSLTGVCQSSSNPSDRITTTFGKGFLFTYSYFSENVKPRLQNKGGYNFISFDGDGNQFPASYSYTGDKIFLGFYMPALGSWQFYGIYAPEGTQFIRASNYVDVVFPPSADTEDKRYLSIAVLCDYPYNDANFALALQEAKRVFNDYYKYAYNFVTDTRMSYVYDAYSSQLTTNFNFIFESKRTGGSFVHGQTAFALFPHQWKNVAPGAFFESQNFKTIRGNMKVLKGSSFSTQHKFFGMLPNLTYEVPQTNKARLQNYINTDKNYNPGAGPNTTGAYTNVNAPYRIDTYYSGKAVSKAANLIPIFHQNGDYANRDVMILRLKSELETWYKGASTIYKSFAYDSYYGGIVGIPANFSSQFFTDHHFHYGYFVYASAILALFDEEFANNYRGMVDLLIKDFYNIDRESQSFPFMRNFDVYEGHSWANGYGGSDDRGNDQESSSEEMNAWAGVYLWGVATKNQDWIDLGVYGYTTAYEAIKEYYFDISGDTYGSTAYSMKGVGMLYESAVRYATYFDQAPQTIKGIQVLPLTPSMLYLGYDPSYASDYYNEMKNTTTTTPDKWKDIWLRYQALSDAGAALQTMDTTTLVTDDDGTSLSYSYHFINFFNTLGKVSISHYADNGSFCVMDKGGEKTYIAFNDSSSSYKTVTFKPSSGGNTGSVKVPPLTTASTKNFKNIKYDSLRSMYSEDNWYALLVDKYSDGITVSSLSVSGDRSHIIFPYAFKVSASSSALNSIPGYVHCSSIMLPSGIGADQIKLALFNTQTNLVERVYPAQEITVESEAGGKAEILIKTNFTKTGVYVLVIPNYSTLKGSIKNEVDGSSVTASISFYDTVINSTSIYSYAGAYEIEIVNGINYVITPWAESYIFTPEKFELTASTDTTVNFQAQYVCRVTGLVKNARDNSAVDAVIEVYDKISNSTVTKSVSGAYDVALIEGREYVLTPTAQNFIFNPEKYEIIAGSDTVVNFAASQVFKVSGDLKNAKDDSDLTAEVNVYDKVNNSTETQTFTGAYEMEIIDGGNYAVTPFLSGYVFSPKTYELSASTNVFQDFTALKVYKISGALKNSKDNSDITAVMSVYDKINNSTFTETFTGSYSFDLFDGFEYTITPFTEGFIFSTDKYEITAGSDTVMNFAAAQIFEISGTLKNARNNSNLTAEVNVYDKVSNSTETQTFTGAYEMDILDGRSYTVTPVLSGFLFNPEKHELTASDNVSVNFNASQIFKVSGTLKNSRDNSDITATVSVYDKINDSTSTEAFTGSYSFDLLDGFDYAITVFTEGFVFSTDKYELTAGSDTVVNFAAAQIFKISGTLKNAKDNSNLTAEVNVYDKVDNSTETRTFTGAYEMDILDGRSYTVTPVLSGFLFNPEKHELTASDNVSVNFNASQIFKVSGTLKNSRDNSDITAVVSIYDKINNSTRTQTFTGTYEMDMVRGNNYVLTPYAQGYTFTPADYELTAETDLVKNFTGLRIYKVNGTVKNSASDSDIEAMLSIYDVSAGSTRAQTITGYYEFDMTEGQEYVLSALAQGYLFDSSQYKFTAESAKTLNFKAAKIYRISGTIKNAKDNNDAEAVISIYNTVTKSTENKTFAGSYEVEITGNAKHILTPLAEGFVFNPDKIVFNGGADKENNITAFPVYKSGGQIMIGVKPLDNVLVSVYDSVARSTVSVMTAGGGMYSFDMVYGKHYTVTPVSDDYDFNPGNLIFNSVSAAVLNADFFARVSSGKFVIYPNPYKPSKHGSAGITFSGLKTGAEIKIYNIAGELVFEVKVQTDGVYLWDTRNNSGNKIASGVYIYYIKSDGKIRKGKIALER